MTTRPQMEEIPATALLDPAVIDEPYPFYRRLVAEAPVWPIPGTEVVTVSSFEAVTEAAGRTGELSSHMRGVLYRTESGSPGVFPFDGGPGTDVLATADPPIHARHRAAVFPELVSRRMARLRPEVEEIAHPRVDRAINSSRVELMAAVANAVPIRVVSRLIGWEHEDPDRLLAAAFDSTAVVGATATQDELLDTMARTADILEWVTDQVDHAIDNNADGILGAVATAVNEGDLERLEGIVIIHLLLSAGGESTTSLIGNAVHRLAIDRELQHRLRAQPELIAPFIEEMLRLESPFRYHLRHATVDCELHGVEIPRGSTVLLLWGAANRDPDEYENPCSTGPPRGTTSASVVASTSASVPRSHDSKPTSSSPASSSAPASSPSTTPRPHPPGRTASWSAASATCRWFSARRRRARRCWRGPGPHTQVSC
jgi:cytochrome P450